jgi:hypothetical protein
MEHGVVFEEQEKVGPALGDGRELDIQRFAHSHAAGQAIE